MVKKSSISQPGFSQVASIEATIENQTGIKVLLVDDQAMMGEAVKKMLTEDDDIEFHFCENPREALKLASEIKPTVILQDLVMPDIDGLTMVKLFRSHPITKDVPMIVLSSREEPDIKHQAFSLGANDYMVKLPDKLEVVARIRYHSSAYIHLLERNRAFEGLLTSQAALKAELQEADRYVQSLLPEKLSTDGLVTDWVFTSSTDLGGDSFGYHWIDDEHFAIYLLDVCGHGVGAALLSVSAMNVLRAQSLRQVDFKQPDEVLEGLNETFDMEKQNQMYFTIWYGVYNKTTHTLNYSVGGHPPSLLLRGEEVMELHTPGMVIGGMPGIEYQSKSLEIKPGDKLYVFSDGVYELEYEDKSRGMMTLEDFAAGLKSFTVTDKSKVESMVVFSQEAQNNQEFEDDYSLVEIIFK